MSSAVTSSLREATEVLFECGFKLEARNETIASAAIYFHKFFRICNEQDYDPNLIAATSIYLAGKVEEDVVKIRDVINVFYATLTNNSEPLDLNEHYWGLRDSIVQAELLLLRMLSFKVSNDHPHRYLLHYLKSITEWIGAESHKTQSFAKTCWSIVNDFFVSTDCIKYKPEHIAVSVIHLSLEIHDIVVPSNDEALLVWNEVFCEDLSKDKIFEIINSIVTLYLNDKPSSRNSKSSNSNQSQKPQQSPLVKYTPFKVIDYQHSYM